MVELHLSADLHQFTNDFHLANVPGALIYESGLKTEANAAPIFLISPTHTARGFKHKQQEKWLLQEALICQDNV